MASVDAPDPEEMVPCPYESAHMIRHKRMQYHLVACRKQHRDVPLAKCPFNAKHQVPKVELPYHITSCPDKDLMISNVVHRQQIQPPETANIQVFYENESGEDWEQETVDRYFNLHAGGHVNVYTHPRDQQRQPRVMPEILRHTLPIGLPNPANIGRGQPTINNSVSRSTINLQYPAPNGRGHALSVAVAQPQSNAGFGRGQRVKPTTESPVRPGASRSGPVLEAASPSAAQRQVVRPANTSAFGLSSICPPAANNSNNNSNNSSNQAAGKGSSGNVNMRPNARNAGVPSFVSPPMSEDGDFQEETDPVKMKKKLQKKLKQIEQLEKSAREGKQLDEAQLQKISGKAEVERRLREL